MLENTIQVSGPYNIEQGLLHVRSLKVRPQFIFIDTYEDYLKDKDAYLFEDPEAHSVAINCNEEAPNQYEYVRTFSTGNQLFEYVIPTADLCLDTTHGVFIITISMGIGETNSQVIYNNNQIYCFRRHLMDKTCVPCTDDRDFKRLETLMYYELMFKESASAGRIEDAMKYYGHMLRILGKDGRKACPANLPCTACGCS